MKSILSSLVLLLLVSTAIGQRPGADPKAIDFKAKMDTLGWTRQGSPETPNTGLWGFLNLGYLNSDQWQDFLIIYNYDFELSGQSRVRFGGPSLKDTIGQPIIHEVNPVYYADLNDDGAKDLIGFSQTLAQGKKDFPYFDTSSKNYIMYFADSYEARIIGVTDFNRDGIDDVLGFQGINKTGLTHFMIHYGKSNFTKDFLIFPDDSAHVSSFGPVGFSVGEMGNLPTVVICARDSSDKHVVSRIGLFQYKGEFSTNKIVWISNSDDGGLSEVKDPLIMDITGDGIPDLLVASKDYVYIYKGGLDFGREKLTKTNYFYRIPAPYLYDHENYEAFEGFGKVKAVGDLTGTGIPFLEISAFYNQLGKTYSAAFFYAGGKALDSLYDAYFTINNSSLGNWWMDTVRSVDVLGKTSVLVMDFGDGEGGNSTDYALLMKGDEDIPHRTNPQMVVKQSRSEERISCEIFPTVVAKDWVELQLYSSANSSAKISIYNELGQEILIKEVYLSHGTNEESLKVNQLISGSYLVRISTDLGTITKKVLVRR